MATINHLTDAIYALLPLINDVVSTHSTSSDSQACRRCHVPSPCGPIDTAIAALDLVLQIHVQERARRYDHDSLKQPYTAIDGQDTASSASFLRGLERARTELIDRTISPDTSLALIMIIGSVDIGRRTLVGPADAAETFNHGVLLGILDRAITELADLDPQR